MKRKIIIGKEIQEFNLEKTDNGLKIIIDNEEFNFSNIEKNHHAEVSLVQNNQRTCLTYEKGAGIINGIDFTVRSMQSAQIKKNNSSEGGMTSPMPGKIIKVMVKEGQLVDKGTPLLIMEAMKMEHTIKASIKGKISKIFFAENDLVDGDVELVDIISGE